MRLSSKGTAGTGPEQAQSMNGSRFFFRPVKDLMSQRVYIDKGGQVCTCMRMTSKYLKPFSTLVVDKKIYIYIWYVLYVLVLNYMYMLLIMCMMYCLFTVSKASHHFMPYLCSVVMTHALSVYQKLPWFLFSCFFLAMWKDQHYCHWQ